MGFRQCAERYIDGNAMVILRWLVAGDVVVRAGWMIKRLLRIRTGAMGALAATYLTFTVPVYA